jgi:hypothetical protein
VWNKCAAKERENAEPAGWMNAHVPVVQTRTTHTLCTARCMVRFMQCRRACLFGDGSFSDLAVTLQQISERCLPWHVTRRESVNLRIGWLWRFLKGTVVMSPAVACHRNNSRKESTQLTVKKRDHFSRSEKKISWTVFCWRKWAFQIRKEDILKDLILAGYFINTWISLSY